VHKTDPVIIALQHTKHKLLTFRHRASFILGQAFHYSPENTFYIQGVTGGMYETLGECSLGQTIPI